MEYSQVDMNRLYELYLEYCRKLGDAATDANRSHMSPNPEKTWMELVERTEFERMLKNPTDIEVARLWIQRIIRGKEHEFPGLRVA